MRATVLHQLVQLKEMMSKDKSFKDDVETAMRATVLHQALELRNRDLLPADGSDDVSLLAGWHCMETGNGSAMGPLFHDDGVDGMT